MSQPSVQLRNQASCATGTGNATVFGPPYLEAREQEPPFVPRTCSPSLLGLLAKIVRSGGLWCCELAFFCFFRVAYPKYQPGGNGRQHINYGVLISVPE